MFFLVIMFYQSAERGRKHAAELQILFVTVPEIFFVLHSAWLYVGSSERGIAEFGEIASRTFRLVRRPLTGNIRGFGLISHSQLLI